MANNLPRPPNGQEIISIDSDSPVESPVDSTAESPGSVVSIWDINPPMQNEFAVLGSRLPSAQPQNTATATYEGCILAITAVFPDISHEHIEKLWDTTERVNFADSGLLYQNLIEKILDGGPYPKERDRLKDLKKRKRASPEVEAAKWKYADLRHDPEEYAKVAKARLAERFDMVPTKFIHDVFKEHSHFYGAFFAIDHAERTRDDATGQPFQRLKSKRISSVNSERVMTSLEAEGYGFAGLREEIRAAEARWQKAEDERNAAKERARAKMASDEEYRRNGETMECACCFSDDNPPTDMTHCNGDTPHFFCFACARRNAETDMTSLKYALRCMDQSRCEATFSRDERARFLDATAIEKLERLQQQDEIRRAEMGDLETCPFCEYLAICPPAEIDKVFECQNPECMELSCRLCKEKAHIPLSCEEFKKENGVGERHAIEEARTNALVRSCKKCNVRILKEDGCNKVVCTNCYSVLCDYCGEDISKTKYDHFDTSSGVGRPAKGKCPLYDPSDRKNQQIEKAGKAAMEKVRAENPSLSEEDLKIKFAKAVEDQTTRHHDMSEEGLRRLEERFLVRRAELNERQERLAQNIDAGEQLRRMQQDMAQQIRRHEIEREELRNRRHRNAHQRAAQEPLRPVVRLPPNDDRGQRPPGFPDIDLARLGNRDIRAEPHILGRYHDDNILYQARNAPFPPHAPFHNLEGRIDALPGNLGSVDQPRDQIARDFPPGNLGFGPFVNDFLGPCRRDGRYQGDLPNHGILHDRPPPALHRLADLDGAGDGLGRGAREHNRRNDMLAAEQIGQPFPGFWLGREVGPRQDDFGLDGTGEGVADGNHAQRPARRPSQLPENGQNLGHIDPANPTEQKNSANQETRGNREDFVNIPGFNPLGHLPHYPPLLPHYPPHPHFNPHPHIHHFHPHIHLHPYAPPQHFGTAIDTPIDLEADPARWGNPPLFGNADQNLPNSVDRPGSIFGPRTNDRRPPPEPVGEDEEVAREPRMRRGHY